MKNDHAEEQRMASDPLDNRDSIAARLMMPTTGREWLDNEISAAADNQYRAMFMASIIQGRIASGCQVTISNVDVIGELSFLLADKLAGILSRGNEERSSALLERGDSVSYLPTALANAQAAASASAGLDSGSDEMPS